MKEFGVNLSHIESRSSKRFSDDYEFLIEIDTHTESANIDKALAKLEDITTYMQIISREPRGKESVPWFPVKIKEIDRFANHVLSYGSELQADHPVSPLFHVSL